MEAAPVVVGNAIPFSILSTFHLSVRLLLAATTAPLSGAGSIVRFRGGAWRLHPLSKSCWNNFSFTT